MAIALRKFVLHKRPHDQNFGMYLGEDIPSGLYVITVEPNSPAAISKIRPGDRVLAVNGQLVSSMSKDPKRRIAYLAKHSHSLELEIQSSNVLDTIDMFSSTNRYNSSLQENFHIHRNSNDFCKPYSHNKKLYNKSNYDEYFQPPTNYSPHRRSHKRRKTCKEKETQTDNNYIQDENKRPAVQHRSIPSMGTSHVLLRSSQTNPKDDRAKRISSNKSSMKSPSLLNNYQTHTNHNMTYEHSSPFVSNFIQNSFDLTGSQNIENQSNIFQNKSQAKLSKDQKLYEIILNRFSNYSGFGFHLQYNQNFYMVISIEKQSPAERSGLRENDIILKINNQSTKNMPYESFVRLVNESQQISLIVQTIEDFLSLNPELSKTDILESFNSVNSNKMNNDGDIHSGVLTKFFSKLRKR